MAEQQDTAVKQILEAIEYGQLQPRETGERLTELIGKEAGREDRPADMRLISAAQDLLEGLHGVSAPAKVEEEARLERLKTRIDATVAQRSSCGTRKRWLVKTAAIAAALVLLVLGAGLTFNWFDGGAMNGGERFVIRGHEVSVESVSRALAKHSSVRSVEVESFSEFDELLGVALNLPEVIDERWVGEYGIVHFVRDAVEIHVRYADRLNERSYVACQLLFFTSPEEVYFVFEQSGEGRYVKLGGDDIYLSRNLHRNSATWYGTQDMIHVSGYAAEEEILRVMQVMKGE